MAIRADKLEHPLRRFGGVPLPREVLDEVLVGYRRPNDKVSEWKREGALEKLEFFAYFLVRLRRKTSMNLGNRQSIGRKDFVR